MGNKLMTELVIEQSLHTLQTAASETIKQAATAYHNEEMIRSANLFLKGWRILHIENMNYLAGRFELLPHGGLHHKRQCEKAMTLSQHPEYDPEELACDYQERLQMGHCVLADLAMACLHCTGEYKVVGVDGYYSYKLDHLGVNNVDYGQTTIEAFEFDSKIWPRGSRVCHMFPLEDDIGCHIARSENFAHAAHTFANHGLCLLPLLQSDYYKFKVRKTLEKIRELSGQEHYLEMVTNKYDKEMEM